MYFYTTWKRQKASSFFKVFGGIEMEYCPEMSLTL